MKKEFLKYSTALSVIALSLLSPDMAGKAFAMSGPTAIEIDGGLLGPLELSGGAGGYFAYLSDTSNKTADPGSFNGDKSTSANLAESLVELQKTTGELQYTIEIGASAGTPTLGGPAEKATVNAFRTGPLYAGYITVAPTNSPVTVSVGQIGSVEGFESALTYNNANLFASDIWYVENSQSVGVSANYAKGPVNVTVEFGDGWDTRVFNFVQALGTYTINDTNSASLFYAGNLSRTGVAASTYNQTQVGYGNNFINSQMYGAFYSFTTGNLNIVPEVQYVYAKVDHQVGIDKFTSNFGVTMLGDYSFGKTPYSLGAMAEYFTSNGPSYWFIAPHAEGVGFELTPTWQYKDLYARVSAGYLHLLDGSYAGDGVTGAYGNSGHGKNVFSMGLESGILF